MTEALLIDPASEVATVVVELGSRAYPIQIGRGLIEAAPRYLTETLPGARYAIVADEAVAELARTLAKGLSAHGLLVGPICFVPSGEGSKSFASLQRVCGALLDLGIERSHAVIALGGGVVGDLAGFAAAILKRGVRLVQIPTTLLAQVDSSVGGKTGINSRHGKNLIGAFHQPSLVLADLDALKTLPLREFRSGYAEIVKYGALGDAEFFDWLDANRARIFAGDSEALIHAVRVSCATKASIVARDETETGERALLNLGHTFGHAVEAWAGYSGAMLHGETVALGMVLAAEFSHRQGLCEARVAERLSAHLSACGFATDFKGVEAQTGRRPGAAELVDFMAQDKKVRHGKLTFILMRSVGRAFIAHDIPREAVLTFLEEVVSR